MIGSSVWIVCREYAGIAEAGGVKNVACSLSEGLARISCPVTVFLPFYGCVSLDSVPLFGSEVTVDATKIRIQFSETELHGVRIILVDSMLYREKQGVYVYTAEDSLYIPGAIKGKGHIDIDTMNIVLQKAVIVYAQKTGSYPDVLHCQDAHTALLPALIRTDPLLSSRFEKTRIIVTIHNAGPGYRQALSHLDRAKSLTGLPEDVLSDAVLSDRVEPFLLAGRFGILSTVSPWYAEELTDPAYDQITEKISGEFYRRRISITGITNGIDYHRYDPRNPSASLLPYPFDPMTGDLAGKYQNRAVFHHLISKVGNKSGLRFFGNLEQSLKSVYFVYQGRLAWQKGLDVFETSACSVLECMPEARFIVMGQGDPVLEQKFIDMAALFSGRFLFISGYEKSFARLAVAISDFLVLPSIFEPCGLEDYIGQIFGTIPVAHAVGGLRKILNNITGFLYASSPQKSDSEVLSNLLCLLGKQVLQDNDEGVMNSHQLLQIIKNASVFVQRNASWDSVILNQYLPLYTGV